MKNTVKSNRDFPHVRRSGYIGAASLLVCAFAACASFADARIPIIGWGSWDEKGASAERYAEAGDAGFTHLTQWCTSSAEAKRLLGEAEKAGIKLIIGLGHDVKRMMDAAKDFTAATKDSPALAYYYITDEPNIKAAETIRDCVKRYEALDPGDAAIFAAPAKLKADKTK